MPTGGLGIRRSVIALFAIKKVTAAATAVGKMYG
jgi:hypothetical protein